MSMHGGPDADRADTDSHRSRAAPAPALTGLTPTHTYGRPTPPPGHGGHHHGPVGGLADTGASATLFAASGSLLLVAAGLFLLGRRRPKR
ncbi:LPXTG cell wall anchor domain-containing protein [Streptomyces sp. LN549]|uniref:LPXTG cell wall anchor domain-containing protein n=1 Tax=Streptomyces sp. LN549 TaxID=3112979 RepID=UPI00372236F0